jgi:hypothetical protein
MPRKPKLEELLQTDGELQSAEFIPTTLDQIMGDTGIGKYGTMNESDYEQKLTEMNKSDLYAHASQVGIMPIDSRDRLVKNLLRQFKNHVTSFRRPKMTIPGLKPISADVMKIIAEGR